MTICVRFLEALGFHFGTVLKVSQNAPKWIPWGSLGPLGHPWDALGASFEGECLISRRLNYFCVSFWVIFGARNGNQNRKKNRGRQFDHFSVTFLTVEAQIGNQNRTFPRPAV